MLPIIRYLLRKEMYTREKRPGDRKALLSGQKPMCVESTAPRDLAACTRPCLLCTSCIGSLSGCAGRCSPLRTPCIYSFADCARIAPSSPLLLAFPLCCPPPRLLLAPPAYCCPLLSPHPLPCCRLNLPSPQTTLPCAPRGCSSCHCPCEPWLGIRQRAPCPCRRRQRNQLPQSSSRPRSQPPRRHLSLQAPCPCR